MFVCMMALMSLLVKTFVSNTSTIKALIRMQIVNQRKSNMPLYTYKHQIPVKTKIYWWKQNKAANLTARAGYVKVMRK